MLLQQELETLDAVSIRIRRLRKVIGISQKKLAKLCGMSQSTVARLESDIRSLNPSYETVFRVLDALAACQSALVPEYMANKKAEDIMHKKIVYVGPSDTIERAIELIKDYDFPQIPVLTRTGSVIGAVTQKRLLTIATEKPAEISRVRVGEVAGTSLPQIDKETPISKLKPMLENFDAILVTEDGKAVGIITIYNILKLV